MFNEQIAQLVLIDEQIAQLVPIGEQIAQFTIKKCSYGFKIK